MFFVNRLPNAGELTQDGRCPAERSRDAVSRRVPGGAAHDELGRQQLADIDGESPGAGRDPAEQVTHGALAGLGQRRAHGRERRRREVAAEDVVEAGDAELRRHGDAALERAAAAGRSP